MELIRKQDKIDRVADHWKNVYSGPRGWYSSVFDAESVYTGLIALTDDTRTEDRVNRIIGNNYWTRNTCDECGQDAAVLVQVGQEPDYESRTACVCVSCLRMALSTATGQEE